MARLTGTLMVSSLSGVAVRALLASIAWPTWRAREGEGERESTVEIEWEPCVLPRDIVVWCASSGAHEHENKNDGSDDSCLGICRSIYIIRSTRDQVSRGASQFAINRWWSWYQWRWWRQQARLARSARTATTLLRCPSRR